MEGSPLDTDNDKSPLKNIVFKVIVVGEPACGKSTLVKRYVNGTYDERYKSTLGASFCTKVVRWDSETLIHLHLWDLAGQDRLNNQTKVYYREAAGALCVCDISRHETKEQVLLWREMVKERATRKDGSQSNPPCVMIINKMDLYPNMQNRSWIDEDLSKADILTPVALNSPKDNDINNKDNTNGLADQCYDNSLLDRVFDLSRELGFESGCPVSVKDGIGVSTAMKILIELMMRRYHEDEDIRRREEEEAGNRIDLEQDQFNKDNPAYVIRNKNRCQGYC